MKREEVIIDNWDEWIAAELAAGAENTHIIYERTGVTPKQIERITKEWIHAFHLLKWKAEQIKAIMPVVKEYGYSLSQLLSAGNLSSVTASYSMFSWGSRHMFGRIGSSA